MHHHTGEDEHGAGEPRQVVVVDGSRQVLRLGEQRDQRRGSDREVWPHRKEAPRDQEDGEDGEHAEHH